MCSNFVVCVHTVHRVHLEFHLLYKIILYMLTCVFCLCWCACIQLMHVCISVMYLLVLKSTGESVGPCSNSVVVLTTSEE